MHIREGIDVAQNIYDNGEFNLKYDKMRTEDPYNANELIEIPTMHALVPDVTHKRVLDLGCGYGTQCRKMVELGADYVLGIDISSHMISQANEQNKEEKIEYQVLAMEDLNTLNYKFDVIVSSLAIHYVEDFKRLCRDISNLLEDGGYFVFSQEHPMKTAMIPNKDKIESDKIYLEDRQYYLLSDYKREGQRSKTWYVEDVIKYHRTLSTILNILIETKFQIKEIREPIPSEVALKLKPKYINNYDRPYFLFVKVQKEAILD